VFLVAIYMGDIHDPLPVLLIIAASSRHEDAIVRAKEWATGNIGTIEMCSESFEFTETDYNEATMGPNLKKQFIAFRQLVDPASLATIKCRTNRWELEYAQLGGHPEPRPLNLDPGYITPAKLVLASTKDHAHRIYLRDGIYAEITLSYRKRKWQPLEWTYPDYLRDDYHQFFTRCREWLLNCSSNDAAVK
jgi:hypothetical protein